MSIGIGRMLEELKVVGPIPLSEMSIGIGRMLEELKVVGPIPFAQQESRRRQ